MKKYVRVLAIILCLACAVFAFAACKDKKAEEVGGVNSELPTTETPEENAPEPEKPKPLPECAVVFKLLNKNVTLSTINRIVAEPDIAAFELNSETTKFTGWYTDDTYTTLFDFSKPVPDDMIRDGYAVVCGKAVRLYNIVFSYVNSSGEQKSVKSKVDEGQPAAVPDGVSAELPALSDDEAYLWSEVGIGVKVYDFNSAVNRDFTLYGRVAAATSGLEYTPVNSGAAYAASLDSARAGSMLSLVVPDKHQGKPVVSFARTGSGYFIDTQDVLLGDNIETISAGAFEGATSLTAVRLPEGLLEIGASAFADCGALKSAKLPSTLRTLGERAFLRCGLEKTATPDGLALIPASAFEDCRNLVSLSLGRGLRNIGVNAFKGVAIASLVLPDLGVIGEGAFEGCRYLVEVVLPESVTAVGARAFNNCASLVKVVVGNAVASIGDAAFKDDEKLSQFNIPLSVASVGREAFVNTAWEKAQSGLLVKDGWVLGYKGVIAGVITIPSITGVADGAFFGRTDLTGLSVADGVKFIGASAFENCVNLVDAGISKTSSLEKIGLSAFAGCVKLGKIVIPDKIASVAGVFAGCDSAVEIYLGAKFADISDIRAGVFGNAKLERFDVSGTNASYKAINGVLFSSVGGQTLVAFPAAKTLSNGAYRVPDATTAIGAQAFLSCLNLHSVALNKGGSSFVATIGDGAFKGCSNLASIDLGDGVAGIQPFGVAGIGAGAFEGCAIDSIKLPASVTSVGAGAFASCSNLRTVYISSSYVLAALADADSVGGLLKTASIVYIANNIASSEKGAYFTTAFEKGAADVSGFEKWTKKVAA